MIWLRFRFNDFTDRTTTNGNGRVYATVLRLSAVCLSVCSSILRSVAEGIDPLLPECHGTSSGSWMERWIICGVLLGMNQ